MFGIKKLFKDVKDARDRLYDLEKLVVEVSQLTCEHEWVFSEESYHFSFTSTYVKTCKHCNSVRYLKKEEYCEGKKAQELDNVKRQAEGLGYKVSKVKK